MPKSDGKLRETVLPDPVEPAEAPVEVVDEPRAPEQTPDEQPDAVAPPVKIQLAKDFDDEGGDVFISIADLPQDLVADGEHDRFKIPTTPTEVPALVAAALVESPAVELAE